MSSKLLQAQIRHEHLVVRTLLVSWLSWTSLPGESMGISQVLLVRLSCGVSHLFRMDASQMFVAYISF